MIAVVMYRNPIQEWWYESGYAYWAILGFVGLFSLGLIICVIVDLWSNYRRKRK